MRRLREFRRRRAYCYDNAIMRTQKDLSILRIGDSACEIRNRGSPEFRILDYCPKLRVLQCDSPIINLELADLPRLVSLISILQSCSLRFEVNMSPDTPMYEVIKHLPERFDLTTLEYGNSTTNEKLCIALLERCPSLRRLKLYFVSDEILQTIFKHLVSKLCP